MKRSRIIDIIKSMLVCAMALSVQFSFAQDTTIKPEEKIEKFRKSERQSEAKAAFQERRAQIDDIKADSSLTPQEKKTKIKNIRDEFRSEKAFTKLDRKKGKGDKSKFRKGKSKNKAARVVNNGKLKEEIQSIKNDASLSDDEKLAKIADLKSQHQELRKANKAKFKDEIKAIKDNANLTEEEKADKIKELRSNRDFKRKKPRKRNRAQNQGILKAKKLEKAKLDPERAKKALKQLDKSESKFNKQYKKGKITEAEFSEKINRIQKLRAQLSN